MTTAQGVASGALSGASIGSNFGPWGTVAGGLIGGAMGLFGSRNSANALRDQYNYQLNLQKQQQDYNTWMYQHRYQMQMQDLKAAKIHPFYGLGNAPSVTSGMGSVGMPDYAGETISNKQLILQGLQIAQDWSAKKAAIENTKQKTKTEQLETQYKGLEVLEKQINNKYLPKKIKTELEEAQSRIILNIQTANKQKSDITTAKEMRKEYERINKFHEEHPKLSKFIVAGKEMNKLADTIDKVATIPAKYITARNKKKREKK